VVRDLQKLIDQKRPTDIFVTHPADDHPDHSVLPNFVQAALRRLPDKGRSVRIHYYLVHRGDWPLPQGYAPNRSLLPPASMMGGDTQWRRYTLSALAEARKAEALQQYASQMPLTGRFLWSFVRQSEVFGAIPEIKNAGVMGDAVGDNLVRYTNPGADLTHLTVQEEGRQLRVRVRLQGNASPLFRYVVHVQAESGWHATRTVTVPATPLAPKKTVEATVPLPEGTERVWVAAETRWTKNVLVDRMGYRPVEITSSQD
jgi:hypothetical protein